MQPSKITLALSAVVVLVGLSAPAADRYVSLSGGHVPPFTSWADAATNIQDAIDAAAAGETVWVTNGIYATGGKVMADDLTNRVALNKALTVRSVNGPDATIIDGASLTNGPTAVRCAWLTNGAVLNGFTLCRGATKGTGSAVNQLGNGGGAWGISTNATVVNCVISSNLAYYSGGGAYRVKLESCAITSNQAVGFYGGGVAYSSLKNCSLTGNKATSDGGGAYYSALVNCAITKNWAGRYGGAIDSGTAIQCTLTENQVGSVQYGYGHGGGASYAVLTNCVVYGNVNLLSPTDSGSNYYNSTFLYSCTAPLPAGVGNIGADPRLLMDSIHLATNSPCLGVGTNSVTSGTDIDGQPWGNPPAMGCDEWHSEPLIAKQPKARFAGFPGELVFGPVDAAGAGLLSFWWLKEGVPLDDGPKYTSTHATNLTIKDLNPSDAGAYRVVVSNSFGMATSTVASVVIHCADQNGILPTAPYASWATAATNIQDAIDSALPDEFVLVTNGVYSYGGKSISAFADLTNRVALDKALAVMSVGGPANTIIQGAWDPSTTNGPLAARCAWLTNDAVLSGFTLTGGATLLNGIADWVESGGGVWGVSTGALVMNCIIRSNYARYGGGGSHNATLRSCYLQGNKAETKGGGAYSGLLVNCTVTENDAPSGGGIADSKVINSIVTYNTEYGFPYGSHVNFYFSAPSSGKVSYSCDYPATLGLTGTGIIQSNAQLLGGYRLAATSPCRGAGTNIASGVDLDGELWASPPSMGCDEVWESGNTGPLEVAIDPVWPSNPIPERCWLTLPARVNGRPNRVGWDYGDGFVLTNASLLWHRRIWTNAGDYTVTFTAYNADNPGGVSTNFLLHVVPLESPNITSAGLSGTNFILSFASQVGATYAVEQTTNLAPPVTWQTVSTVFAYSNGTVQVTDAKATNDTRFYRVKGP
jgi:hypothetical protein